MADDDDSFPPEIQKPPSEFGFRELSQLKISKDRRCEYSKIRSSLLAVANVYGYVFVGVPDAIKVYSSVNVLAADKAGNEDIDAITTIYLRNAPNWIAVNSDNLTLAVCCCSDKGPQILFFDIRNILNKLKPTKTPFCSCVLSKTTSAAVSSLHWNPSTDWPNLIAVCLSTGSFHLLSVESTVKEIGIRPDDFGASAVCWSPKGKQLIIGKNDGTLHQFTPKLEVRRSISVTSVIDRPVRACDIIWLSTFHLAAGYIAIDTEDGDFTQPNMFFANIPTKNEQRDIIWRNYEDPCFGVNDTQDPHYFITFLDQWEMFITFSSNSTDSAVIAKNKETQTWEIWTLDDSVRAGVPMSEFTQDDAAPVGVALITTAKDRITVDDSRECGPMPVLVILTNDGILCPFHTINLMGDYPSLVTETKQLGLEGERMMSGVQGVGGGDSKQPPTSGSKQRLTAKPSVRATSTPKPGLNLFHAKSNSTPLPTPILMPTTTTSTAFSASNLYGEQTRFTEGASILQDLPSIKPLPSSTTEAKLPKPSLPPFRKGGLNESADSVFDANDAAINPNDTVFAPKAGHIVRDTPQQAVPVPQPAVVKTPLTKQNTLLPQKPAVSSLASPKFGALGTSGLGSSAPPTEKPPLFTAPAQNDQLPSQPRGSSFQQGSGLMKKPDISKQDKKYIAAAQPSRKRSTRVTSNADKTVSRMAETSLEIATFEDELKQLLSSSMLNVEGRLGGPEERFSIKKDANDLSIFSREITSTTKELGSEIQDVFSALNELQSVSSDVEQRQKRTSDKPYQSMLYTRPLDQGNRAKMKALRELCQYVSRCVRDTNTVLDSQWEDMYNRRKLLSGKMPSKDRKLDCSDWEKAHQILSNNLNVLHEQEVRLVLVAQQLDRLRLDGARLGHPHRSGGTGRGARALSPFPTSANLPLLAENLLSRKDQTAPEKSGASTKKDPEIGEKPVAPPHKKLSPKKQLQLGHVLANRKVAPVRSSGHVGPSMIRKPILRKQESTTSHASSSSSDSAASAQSKTSETWNDVPHQRHQPGGVRAPSERFPPKLAVFETRELISPKQDTSSSETASSTSPELETAPAKEPGVFHIGPKMVAEVGARFTSLQTDLAPTDHRQPSSIGGGFSSKMTRSGANDALTREEYRPPSEPASIVPQGSATLAYGAPKSAPGVPRTRNVTSLPTHFTEAASNLNCPPTVVNIQQLQAPILEEPNFPEIFEPKANVPAGAVEVVQAVLNTVKAEKQQQHKEFGPNSNSGGRLTQGSFAPPGSISRSSPVSNLFSKLSEDKTSFQASVSTGAGSTLGYGVSSTTAPVSAFSTPASESVLATMRPRSSQVAPSTTFSITPNVQSAPSIASLATKPLEVSARTGTPTTEPPPYSPVQKPGLFTLGPPDVTDSLASSKGLMAPLDAAVTSTGAPTGSVTPPEETITQQSTGVGLFASSQKVEPAAAISRFGAFSFVSASGAATTDVTTTATTHDSNVKSTLSFATPATVPAPLSGGGTATTTDATNIDASAKSTVSAPEPAVTGVGDGGDATASDPKPGLFESGSMSGTTAGGGIFGTGSKSSGIFGGATTTFSSLGAAETKNVFGLSSTFGTQSEKSSVPTPDFEAKSQTTTAPTPVFGAQEQQPSTAPTSAFGAQLKPGLPTPDFGTPNTTVPTPVFGAKPSVPAPTFGTPQATSNAPAPLFGAQTVATSAPTPVFGAQPASTGSIFGAKPQIGSSLTTGFGVQSQAQGQSTPLFGAQAQQTSGLSFANLSQNQAPAVSQGTGLFGAAATTGFGTAAFGQSVFGASSQGSAFGQVSEAQPSAFGGGFFSGLGGKPVADAANKNPFAVGGEKNENTGMGGSLFGNSGAKSFGTSAFGQAQQKSFGFGENASTGVGSQGFGGFNKLQSPGGIGAASAFGSAPTFGSPPSFGSTGPGRVFGGGFGSQPTQGGTGFGQNSGTGAGGFASFAKTETAGFGNLAQQSGGGFGSFGSPAPQQQSPFGGNAQKSPSFSGWR